MFETNMLDYLWLNAYLPNFIIQEDIFNNMDNLLVQNKINNLLISEKWQRFDWDMLIKDNFPVVKYNRENHLVVSGKITGQLIKVPIKNCSVNMTVLNEFYFNRNYNTDENGRFYFDGIDLYDRRCCRLRLLLGGALLLLFLTAL